MLLSPILISFKFAIVLNKVIFAWICLVEPLHILSVSIDPLDGPGCYSF